MDSLEKQFIHQISESKKLLKSALENTIELIFSIYDYDGDGGINFDEFIALISDLLYIAVLTNRIGHNEYTIENVLNISRWASSNFKNNLFRTPQQKVGHDDFVQGLIYALTENKGLPIFPENNVHIISFLPELLHFFDYYEEIAKRRGWPLEETKPEEIIDEIPRPQSEESESVSKENAITSTQEQQILEYRERHRQKQNEKKDKQEEDRLRNIHEQHDRQDAQQRIILEQQARLEQEQREREQRNLAQENLERQRIILQQQVQQITQLQNQFRERLRQERNNHQVDQFGDAPACIELETAGDFHIDEKTMGFDVIEGDINVLEYVDSNKEDNIVFQVGDSYFLASKERIKSMIRQGERDNSLFYGCMCELEGPWNRPETWALLEQVVIPHTIYFNIQQLGLPIRYVDLKEIEAVLQSEKNFFLIEKPHDVTVFPSFASDNVLNHGIGSMSGAHCNDGQMDIVYRIKKFIYT